MEEIISGLQEISIYNNFNFYFIIEKIKDMIYILQDTVAVLRSKLSRTDDKIKVLELKIEKMEKRIKILEENDFDLIL